MSSRSQFVLVLACLAVAISLGPQSENEVVGQSTPTAQYCCGEDRGSCNDCIGSGAPPNTQWYNLGTNQCLNCKKDGDVNHSCYENDLVCFDTGKVGKTDLYTASCAAKTGVKVDLIFMRICCKTKYAKTSSDVCP